MAARGSEGGKRAFEAKKRAKKQQRPQQAEVSPDHRTPAGCNGLARPLPTAHLPEGPPAVSSRPDALPAERGRARGGAVR